MLIWPKREFLIKSLFNNVSQIYLVKSYCGIIMDTPIVILNYKTYLESSGINALELAHDFCKRIWNHYGCSSTGS